MKVMQMAGVIAAWAIAMSLAVGTFATVCGAALGAVHGHLDLAASFGERGILAGLIAGVIVGVCVAVDRLKTESYLAKTRVALPPASEWPTVATVKPRYSDLRMTPAKSLREG
jgi:hypothetical protein